MMSTPASDRHAFALLKRLACPLVVVALLLSFTVRAEVVDDVPLYYLHDENATHSVEDIAALKTNAFRRVESSRSASFSGSGYHWFYVSLAPHMLSATETWYLQIDFPNLDVADIYVRVDGETRLHERLGDEVRFKSRSIDDRRPTIELPASALARGDIIIRVEQPYTMFLPLSLIDSKTLIENQTRDSWLYGAFFASLLILALVNLCIFGALRDPSYFYYVIYLLAFGLMQASVSGLGQQYAWPELANGTTFIGMLCLGLVNIAIPLFAMHFIEIRRYAPEIFYFLVLMQMLAALAFVPMLFTDYAITQNLLLVFSSISMTVLLFCAVYCVWQGNRSARYLTAAYALLFPACGLSVLRYTGVLPTNFWTEHALEFAIIAEAVILSIGLTDRINKLRLAQRQSETDRRVSQENFSREILQVREREKKEIGHVLHDSVSHELLITKNKLADFSADLALDEGQANALNAISRQLNLTVEAVRDLSHLSHPHVVEQLGLEAGVDALLQHALEGSDINWSSHFEHIKLTPETELLLYRVTQESLNNVLKHAQASECIVRLRRNGDGETVYSIKDDGKGISPGSGRAGFGLRLIEETVKMLEGKMQISSDKKSGTTLRISFRPPSLV